MREIDGLLYINTGDWVESCTAIVETSEGAFEIIRWAEMVEARDSNVRRFGPARAAA